jgi:hypothetical protein
MEHTNVTEPASSSAIAYLLSKVLGAKFSGLICAVIGAGLMAMLRPPKDSKSLAAHGFAALGTCYLIGDWVVSIVVHSTLVNVLLNVSAYSPEELTGLDRGVNGLLGMFAWGLLSAALSLRDKMQESPISVLEYLRSWLGGK